jgi:hypothetical protein
VILRWTWPWLILVHVLYWLNSTPQNECRNPWWLLHLCGSPYLKALNSWTRLVLKYSVTFCLLKRNCCQWRYKSTKTIGSSFYTVMFGQFQQWWNSHQCALHTYNFLGMWMIVGKIQWVSSFGRILQSILTALLLQQHVVNAWKVCVIWVWHSTPWHHSCYLYDAG